MDGNARHAHYSADQFDVDLFLELITQRHVKILRRKPVDIVL